MVMVMVMMMLMMMMVVVVVVAAVKADPWPWAFGRGGCAGRDRRDSIPSTPAIDDKAFPSRWFCLQRSAAAGKRVRP